MNIVYFIMKQGDVLGHTENFSEASAEAKEHNATVVPFVPAMAVAQALDDMGRVLSELADNARENGCPLEAKGMEDAGQECLDEAGRISAGVGPVVSESVVQQLVSMVEMAGPNGARAVPLHEHPAPRVAVPEEREWNQAAGRDDLKHTEGWNACRDAVLAAPTTPQVAVPEGWTDRHTRITRFALWRLINEGYHRARVAAQKGQPGTADDAAALLEDVERAEEARSMLAALTAPAGEQPVAAPDERKTPAPPDMIADCLYQAGYEDAKKERDYNPRAMSSYGRAAMGCTDDLTERETNHDTKQV